MHLVKGLAKLAFGRIADPLTKRRENRGAVMPANGQDERKSETLPVLIVQVLERCQFLRRTTVKARARLFPCRGDCQLTGKRKTTGEIRDARKEEPTVPLGVRHPQ